MIAWNRLLPCLGIFSIPFTLVLFGRLCLLFMDLEFPGGFWGFCGHG